MNTALSKAPAGSGNGNGNGIGIITESEAKLTREDLETIRNTIFKGAEDSELRLYLHDCQRQAVHPLDRLIHPSVRVDRKTGERRYTPITSIDLFRARAEDTGLYAGNDDPVYSGQPRTESFAASVTVWKIVGGQRCAFTATARWSEYVPPQGSDWMWQKMPHLMLAKCAEALALRKAFPRQLSGIYTKDEMDQAGERADVVPLVGTDESSSKLPAPESSYSPGGGSAPVSDSPVGEPPPASAQAKVGPAAPPNAEQVTVLKTAKKEGVKNGKPWTMYGLMVALADGSELWANTFDHTLGAEALRAQSGSTAWVVLEKGKVFNGKQSFNFTFFREEGMP